MNLLVITHALNFILMIGLGFGVGAFLVKRFNLSWRLWWLGAATFVLSQVAHIPFNSLLSLFIRQGVLPWPTAHSQTLIATAIVGGLSAGLFEEISRYLVLRYWAKDARSWRKGILYGAGHGGMEAILLGLLVAYSYFQLMALRGVDLSKVVTADRLALVQQQYNAYWSAPWPITLLGALERALTIPSQIALAVLVLQVFTRRGGLWWLGLAIVYHAVVDAAAIYFSGLGWGAYALEGLVGVFTLISLAILFTLRQPEPEIEPVVIEPLPEVKAGINLPPAQETPESLDRSRYN